MEERVYLTILYDIYGELLTEKQKAYFEAYYFQNLSLGELAEKYQVSREAIHHQIKCCREKLEEYENVLGVYQKKEAVLKLLLEGPLKTKIDEIL